MEKTKSRTNINILFVCLVAMVMSLPIFMLSYLDAENTIRNGNCSIYNNNFKIYGSIFSFIIPLVIMMIMYFLTVKRLKNVLNEFKQKCQKNNMRLSITSSLVDDNTKEKMKKLKEMRKIALKFGHIKKEITSIKTDTSFVKSHNDLMLKPVENNLKDQMDQQKELSTNSINKIVNFNKSCLEKVSKSKIQSASELNNNEEKPQLLVKKPSSRFKFLVNKHLIARQAVNAFRLSRESSVVKNQQKAVKVLGIVLIIFLIAWAPFALVNILSAVCESCSINIFILDIFTWLGYISSTVNPLIYNAFNNNFRHAFKEIIRCNSSSLKKATYTNKQSNQFKAICHLNPVIKKESELVISKVKSVENCSNVVTIIKPTKTKNKVLIKKSISEVNVLTKNFYDAI